MFRLAAVATLALAVCGLAAPAGATTTWATDAYRDRDGATAVARAETPAIRPVRRASTRHCSYTPEAGPTQQLFDMGVFVPPPAGEEGGWFTVICAGDRPSDYVYDYRWVRFRKQTTTSDLVSEARRYLPLPEPSIGTSPPPQFDSVVNLPVFLTVNAADWEPKSATADVPGVAVVVRAVPQRVEWSTGDGAIVVCPGPGTPYDFSRPENAQVADCVHRYRTTALDQPNQRFPVTATVVWKASWSVVGAPGGGDLGEIRRSATTSLRVVQVQTVNAYQPNP